MAEVTGTTPDATTTPAEVVGNVASGTADSGNPVKVGAIVLGTAATPTNLSDGQRTNLIATSEGALVIAGAIANGDGVGSAVAIYRRNSNNAPGPLATGNSGYNGATWDRLRTPNTFKTVSATALGATALWTPAAGKKFRLMGYIVEITSNASLAAGAVEIISMLDSAADIAQTHSVFIPTTAVTTGINAVTTGWIDLGNGVLSAAANNVLNVNLGTALATGAVRVTCCGTEE